MSAHVPNTPTCIGCGRTIDVVREMLSIHHGGMPTCLCGDCVDHLHAKVALLREKTRPDFKPGLIITGTAP